jgi:methoxymalonate biosynthesis acyl carrier protein
MDDSKVKIQVFLSRFFQTTELKEDEDIFALGFINSLFAMQLVTWVEKEFGIRIEDEDLDVENFNTIGAIADLVARKSCQEQGASATLGRHFVDD